MQLDLAGEWSLSDDSGTHRCAMQVPTDGISALHVAGLIPDPYFGRNEYDLRWICERDWRAERTFDLDATDVDLVLSEVDCVATVRVNDQVVLRAENAFRSYRLPLREVAQIGRNTISVTFHSPVRVGAAKQAALPFAVPHHPDNCPIPNGNMLRKPACDFGWDWNIALAPFGIYGVIQVVPAQATRIDNIMVAQSHAEGAVTLDVTVTTAHHTGDVTATIAGQTVSAPSENGTAKLRVTIQNPDLWWPAGQGDQPLYDLMVTAGDATAHRRIGLREIALVTTPDAAGLGFKFRVNGRDNFCKGANWIPADALAGQITDAKTRDLLQSAVDANMNMIRVWGGGRYERESFYDTCDELGLLVWQDFMFACNLYPSTPAFLAEVTAEVVENVARIQHHACLALWCGDNELIGALNWYEVSRKDRDRYLVNYDRLNRCIETALKDTDPHAIWWPSSPSPGLMSFGDAWHDDGSGDMHFWSVWHEGRDFDHYRDVAPRFCSEFGFQSYPSMNAIRRFTGEDDRNIAAPVLESHQKNKGGNARIAETMFRYFRWPKHFDDFVYLSQIQQGLAIKTAVTHWRSLKPHCMGTLIWQLNDTWPVCSWASLDHGGDWKLLHHMTRAFYAPLLVTAVPVGDRIVLRGINDNADARQVQVTVQAITPAGARRDLWAGNVTLGAEAVDLHSIALSDLATDEMLAFHWQDDNGVKGSDIHAPRPFKSYNLAAPELSMQVDGLTVTLATQHLALFVAVEADVAGRWSDNVLHLLPGETRTLTFAPADPASTPHLTLRDLHSATYA
jgi:beta-mannosidase